SRPLSFGGDDASLVIATDRNEGFRALAWSQALVIGGTLLITLLQLILVLTTMRSVSKPIEVIVDHLSQVSQGNSVGILPEAALRGQFLRLGKQVNMILQLMPSAARPGQALGALQGPSPLPGTPPGVPTPSLAGMANGGGLTNGRETSGASLANLGDMTLDTRTPSASLSTASARATPSQPPRGADAPPSGLSGLFDEGAPDPLAAFRVAPPAQPAPQAKPAARSHEPPPQPAFEPSFDDAPQPDTAAGPSAMSPEATVMFQVPQELLNQSAQIGGSNLPQRPVTDELPSRPPTSRPMADDARTVVAQVPQELLSAAAPKDNLSNADEAHYKDVYDKFVETRVQCGEDTSDLTYDRFVAKLLKNRQQIIEKHKAKSVRFQVYVKEGKAALRALPVRE
ncbi:MAG TPA: MXAN_5187 C-terminal domain-containing protein, partial [Myxococcota bacterium]